MKSIVKHVVPVSDGILVEFHDGSARYYPAGLLDGNLQSNATCSFVNYDPTPTETAGETAAGGLAAEGLTLLRRLG